MSCPQQNEYREMALLQSVNFNIKFIKWLVEYLPAHVQS